MQKSTLKHVAFNKSNLIFLILFVASLLLGGYTAQVAQWRDDQATNMLLGYRVWGDLKLPELGLRSSYGIPNPNGMPLLGALLSFLPNLLWVSIFLECLVTVLSFLFILHLKRRFPNQQNLILLLGGVLLSSPLISFFF